ncbi:uncharacterized protein LOC129925669 isoform X1 [Biomphalaria glabrata]|uniref:Uncharacterized protein LOC129925669 isoform X1 n=1 Tax=Biomphalaria glabrata TaxID=6526 RepID=A0A9W3A2U4_BIOGL|nr:uncharacterized protein LOC129925669 isoform X1 [Biomphalaria glabrata]
MATSSYVDLKEVKETAIQDGKAMELKGKDLAAYVQQVVKEETERQRQEIERQKEEKRQEIERQDRIRKEEYEKQKEDQERQREHEAKMEKMRLDAAQARAQTEQGNNTNNSNNYTTQRDNPNSQTWLKRKIQSFDEQKDDIGDFLKRYEAKMSTFNMPEEEWSEILIDFVHGQALTICQNHDHHIDDSYQVLKRELLNAYGHNATTFRKKYFDNIPSLGIEPQTTINMEKDFFNKWVKLEKVNSSYEGLKNFILVDNFVNKCDPQLQSFIRERNPKTIDEITEIMRVYKNAYPNKPFSDRDKSKVDLIGYTKENVDRSRNRNRSNSGNRKYSEITCFKCQGKGHIAANCRRGNSRSGSRNRYNEQNNSRYRSRDRNDRGNYRYRSYSREYKNKGTDRIYFMEGNRNNFAVYPGFVDRIPVELIRDSGCNTLAVKTKFVKPHWYKGFTKKVELADGTVREFKAIRVYIETPFFTGYCDGIAIPEMRYDMLVGNIKGVKECSRKELEDWQNKYKNIRQNHENIETQNITSMVITRSMDKQDKKQENTINVISNDKEKETSNVIQIENTDVKEREIENETQNSLETQIFQSEKETTPTFALEQMNDNIIGKIYSRISDKNNNNPMEKFCIENKILFRQTSNDNKKIKQLVLPQKYWKDVLIMTHDNNLAAHRGVKKCYRNLSKQVFWPKMKATINKYINSCDICQKRSNKSLVNKAPIQEMDEPTEPFQKVSIDLIGPLIQTENNNKYILTVIDMFSRYPEAIPLSNTSAENIINAITQKVITRHGIPKIILSDQGSQFKSEQFKKWTKQYNIQHIYSSVYHPESNDLCERYGGSLKRSLTKIIQNNQNKWDHYINYVLFAHRNNIHEATQFSPYEVIHGRKPRDELDVFKENLIDNENKLNNDSKTTITTELKEIWTQAYNNNKKYKQSAHENINKKRQLKTLEVGNNVLILINDLKNKIGKQWKGPFKVIKQISDVNYQIEINGKIKTYHINNLKLDHDREDELIQNIQEEIENTFSEREECLMIITNENHNENDIKEIPVIETKENQTWQKINLNNLTKKKSKDITKIIQEYKEIFSSIPGKTNIIKHDIKVTDTKLIKLKPYRIPLHLQDKVKKEIDNLLESGIIEPSTSPLLHQL